MGVSTDAILYYGFELCSDEDSDEDMIKHDLRFIRLREEFWDLDESPVIVAQHCHYDYPMYYICGYKLRAARGFPEEVNISDVNTESLDAKIKIFCEEHGIKYEQPKWMLVSYWC